MQYGWTSGAAAFAAASRSAFSRSAFSLSARSTRSARSFLPASFLPASLLPSSAPAVRLGLDARRLARRRARVAVLGAGAAHRERSVAGRRHDARAIEALELGQPAAQRIVRVDRRRAARLAAHEAEGADGVRARERDRMTTRRLERERTLHHLGERAVREAHACERAVACDHRRAVGERPAVLDRRRERTLAEDASACILHGFFARPVRARERRRGRARSAPWGSTPETPGTAPARSRRPGTARKTARVEGPRGRAGRRASCPSPRAARRRAARSCRRRAPRTRLRSCRSRCRRPRASRR